jgi:hypothetical protein
MSDDRKRRNEKPRPGQKVVLIGLPEGFIDDLPEDDQRAITAALGKPIILHGYDEDGRAELEFTDNQDVIHTIYVDLRFVGRVETR